ncbi:RNA helicase [Corynebacterium vitaeruminis]|uniref:RNA helicase n=1 Tax=Corynebacterium vitaeruminis TaxID=38305 RepID=UPI0004B4929E|nr:RNA helicase [Corynebacterium vitaeruminis]
MTQDIRETSRDRDRLPRYPERPSKGQIAAAKLIIKRAEEGKGKLPVTPGVRYMASFG